jgi:hypothetical protein
MPLILYFIHRLVLGKNFALPGVAVGWALLIMTHLPTTLIFSVIPFCYAVFLAPSGRRSKILVATLGAAILGVGLSAIYLLPALTTQQFVLLDKMSTGYFSYENWLFFARLSLWRQEKITIALLVFDMAVIASCAFLIARSNSESRRQSLNRFWYILAIASILMMTELSKPIWRLLPVLQRVQFPWRFNTVLSLAVTALLAMAIASMRKVRSPSFVAAKTIAFLFIVVWIPVTVFEARKVFPQTNPNQKDIAERTEQIEQSRDPGEYRPRWNKPMATTDWELSVNEELWDTLMTRDIESLLQRVGSSPGHPPQPAIIEGIGRAEIAARKPRRIDLQVETPTGVKLNVPQFYYPYWTAHLPGAAAELTLTPSQPDGLLSLSVPPGNHEVQLRLERSRVELAGQVISLVSVAIALLLAIYSGYKRVCHACVL